jgi:ketosteroid isomerase-like protein
MLDESQCWKVSGVKTAGDFFRAVSLLVPDATHMFLEGSPDPDIETVLADAADDTDYSAPAGTIWSWPRKNRRFSVRASPELFVRLSEASSNHAEPEICDHVHLYRGGEALVQWFDAFSDPILISKSVAHERVERFASAVGGALRDGAAS